MSESTRHYHDDMYPDMELARAYVPIQIYDMSYRPAVALSKGTFFPELYRPYMVKNPY